MKNKLENLMIAVIAIGVIIAIVYVTNVLPYDNDWRCVFAECRIEK